MNINSIELTSDEVKKEELEILKVVINFFKEHNLTYYICCGTLLGAIRHRGFIPWDDDIDLIMPRPDYEKFENLMKERDFKLNNDLLVTSFNLGNSIYPFFKVINKNIYIDTKSEKKFENNLWIDIFPMDGLAENERKRNRIYKKARILRKLLRNSVLTKKTIIEISPNKFKLLSRLILKYIVCTFFSKTIPANIEKLNTKYSFNTSKYVGGVTWGHPKKGQLLRSEIDSVEIEFEGLKLNTFSGYEKYLSNVFGNYMELPPIEQRKIHYFSARKLIE